jgi:hypothetical protein
MSGPQARAPIIASERAAVIATESLPASRIQTPPAAATSAVREIVRERPSQPSAITPQMG